MQATMPRRSKTFERSRRAAVKRLAKAPVGPAELASIAERHAAKIAEKKYQDAITGADPKATEKLIRGLKSSQ